MHHSVGSVGRSTASLIPQLPGNMTVTGRPSNAKQLPRCPQQRHLRTEKHTHTCSPNVAYACVPRTRRRENGLNLSDCLRQDILLESSTGNGSRFACFVEPISNHAWERM